MLDVAVEVRVLPLSIDECELEVSPVTVNSPPGTVMSETWVSEVADGWVVTTADSLPKPTGDEAGVTEALRLWFPLTDSACTDGGTSFELSVGGPPLQPAASSAVPMAPRSMVWESAWASMFW